MTTPEPERATIKAVVKYAADLRVQAEKQMAADVYAKPYWPTTEAAKQLVKRIANQREKDVRRALDGQDPAIVAEAVANARADAPGLAIARLREKAADARREQREADEQAERSLARHRRRRAQHLREVDAERQGLTLGARLDLVLTALATVAAAPAGSIGGDRVQGGDRAQSLPWAGDPHGYALDRARVLVERLEAMHEDARVRDVEKAA